MGFSGPRPPCLTILDKLKVNTRAFSPGKKISLQLKNEAVETLSLLQVFHPNGKKLDRPVFNAV